MKLLLLAPTPLERKRLAAAMQQPADIQLCGFGPVAAAARCAALIESQQPNLVLLAGIAGTYNTSVFPVATAGFFSQVSLDGIGAGMGEDFIPSRELGFAQWNSHPDGDPIYQDFQLQVPQAHSSRGLLVTRLSASASSACVQLALSRYPQAMAEDMEGAGVALACAIAGVPLIIVRGASNIAGDRNKQNWRIDAALSAAAEKVDLVLEQYAN